MAKNPYENARFERFIGEHGMTALFVIDDLPTKKIKTSARILTKPLIKIRISKITI